MNFIDLKAQQNFVHENGIKLKELINSRISEVIEHGQFILGPEVNELEEKLSKFVGSKYCIGVSSGTDALLIALMALEVKPGDEIITTPFSFISTAETIALLGAIPVFTDIDPISYNLDPNKIEPAITNKTKAIIPVSLYGQTADFSAINTIAEKFNLPVIEDAAQSFGASHNNKKSCNLTTIATTSFFPSKPLGCYGDGGACFTSDEELANKMRLISKHGSSRRYFHTDIGINGRLDTIQAAILLAKLEIFDKEIKKRNLAAQNYTKMLQDKGFNSVPLIDENNISVYAQYTIEINSREEVQSRMRKEGIPTTVHYPTILNHQPALEGKSIAKSCNHALNASSRVLSLPFHPYITESDQQRVTDSLINAI